MEDERLKNKNIIEAFKKAFSGIWYAIRTQKNVKIQLLIAVILNILCFLFKVTAIEYMFISLSIMLVIITEVINTAIETTVNLYTDKYHELAKIAKDVSAGAVVLAALNGIIIATVILISRI